MAWNATKTERLAVIAFSIFECFFHSAILFGWPSLAYILIDLGYYSDLCATNNFSTTTIFPSLTSTITVSPSLSISLTTREPTTSSDVVGCDAQDARLLLIYTISSSLVPCSMLLSGIIFERAGTLVTRIIFSISLLIAYLCIAASSPTVPDLLFPGTIVMGVAGIFIMVSSFEVSNLFPKYKSTVIALLMGSSDSSAIVLLFVKVLYDAGVSMNASFYALTISTLLFSVNTILLPRSHIPWPLPEGYRLNEKTWCSRKHPPSQGSSSIDIPKEESHETRDNEHKRVNACTTFDTIMTSGLYQTFDEKNITNDSDIKSQELGNVEMSLSVTEETKGVGNGYGEKKDSRVLFQDNAGFQHDCDEKDLQDSKDNGTPLNDHQSADQQNVTVTVTDMTADQLDVLANGTLSKSARRATMDKISEDQRLEDFPTTFSILKSPMFLLMTFWTIACQGEIFFVIGIMNPWLSWLADGDTETVSFYTNILAITTIGSLFGAPIIGYIFDRRKQLSENFHQDAEKGPYADLRDSWLPVAMATCTAILMSVLMMIPILPVQFGTFILLTAVRAMFYSASAAIVPISFPMRFYPTVFGTTNFIAGIFSLAQYPLFIIIQDYLDGDPRWVLAGFLMANVLALVYPLYLYVYGKKHEKRYMDRKQSRRSSQAPPSNSLAD